MNYYNEYTNHQNQNYNKQKGIIIGIVIGLSLLAIIFIISQMIKNPISEYYKNNVSQYTDEISQNEGVIQTTGQSQTLAKGKYSTTIIYDNTYSGVSIKSKTDALQLIEQDSKNQKNNCPDQIKTIENNIINKYNITAVNLCEMDLNFAKEIENVIKTIYEEYPSARGYLTNLTLANVSMSEGYIAAFMPIFQFADSNTTSTYPWVIKTQVLLNTTYFLNQERLKASVEDGSNSGHFPPNATIYSPVAHEFGHYLSFIAMMKNYDTSSTLLIDEGNIETIYNIYDDFADGNYSQTIIKEAYENYKNDTNTQMSLDQWRGTISKYALAKDNSGNYIYDETIAEAFHDVYLNKENAKDASKYVTNVLKSKLES